MRKLFTSISVIFCTIFFVMPLVAYSLDISEMLPLNWNGSPQGRMPSKGDVKTATIVLEFPNQLPASNQFIIDLLKNEASKKREAVGEYYKKQSYGKMNLIGDTYYYLAQESYEKYQYTGGSSGKTYFDNIKIINEALLALEQSGVDFSQYDENNDGYIDGLNIECPLRNGFSGSEAGFMGSLVPETEVSGKKARFYTWTQLVGDADINIHETGHLLGLIDRYVANRFHLPAGVNDVMGSTGSYVNIFEKYLLGWVEPTVISKKDSEMKEIKLYATELQNNDEPKAIIFMPDESKYPYTEFYIIEYRKNTGIYLWHTDITLVSKMGYPIDPDKYLKVVYASGDTSKFKPATDTYTAGKVFSANTYPTSDFYDDVFTGIYMEVLETNDEYARIKVGFEESDITPPEIIKASMENNANVDFANFNIDVYFSTAFKTLTNNTYIEDIFTNERIPIETSVSGNALTIKPQRAFERGTTYELVIPSGTIADSSNNAMDEYRLRFNIINRDEKSLELKQIIKVEQVPSTLDMTIETSDGGILELSNVNGEWLGYNYPRLTKYAKTGLLVWALDLEGETEDITALGFEDEYSFYAEKGDKPFKYIFYANDEDGEADGQVKTNYDTARYRVTFNDLSLYVNGEDYEIYYTLDGSNPIYEGIKYDGAVEAERSCTLKAVSVKDGTYSRILERRYYITRQTNDNMGLYLSSNDILAIGYKSDGKINVTGRTTEKSGKYTMEYDFSDFTDVGQIAYTGYEYVGVKDDGTVVTAGDPNFPNSEGAERDYGSLENVIQIIPDLVLKSNGALEYIFQKWWIEEGWQYDNIYPDISELADIVQLDSNNYWTHFILKGDGTVLDVLGYYNDYVKDWKDVISIEGYGTNLFGLTKSGEVLVTSQYAVTDDRYKNEWKDMQQISGNNDYILGIDKNGNVLSTNGDDYSDWTDMYSVYAGSYASYGIRNNGQVVAKGNLGTGTTRDLTDILNWNLLVPEQIVYEDSNVAVNVGETSRLYPKLKGVNKRGISWTSSDPSVVKVEQNGSIKALKGGMVTITAMSTIDNSVYDTCEVTVTEFVNISVHKDFSVTNWNIEENNMLNFTITNLTDKPKTPQLMFVEHNGYEVSDVTVIPIELAEHGKRYIQELIPHGAKVLLWDEVRPIVK